MTKAVSARVGEKDIVDIHGLLPKKEDIRAEKHVGFVRIAATAKWINAKDIMFLFQA